MANLITLEEYKHAGGLTNPKDDARLENLVTSVSQIVKTYCGNAFVDYYDTDKVELVNIEDSSNFLQLKESPIVSVTKVEERASYSSDYVEITEAAFEFYLDSDTDSILRTTSNGYTNWPKGPGSVRVTYKAGYEEIPADLRLACFDIVKYYFKEEYKPSKSIMSTSVVNETTSTQWRNVSWPDHIKRVLDYYKQI